MNEDPKPGTYLSNKQYDLAKWLTVTLFPGLGTLYFALATIWGLPAGQEVLGTMMAIQAFLAVLIGISSNQYESSGAKYSGDLNITQQPNGEKKATFAFNQHPSELSDKKEVVLKVNAPTP